MCGYRQQDNEDKLEKIRTNIDRLTEIIDSNAPERNLTDYE